MRQREDIQVTRLVCKGLECYIENGTGEPLTMGRAIIKPHRRACLGADGQTPRLMGEKEAWSSLPPWCPRWKSEASHYAQLDAGSPAGQGRPGEERYRRICTRPFPGTAWELYETLGRFDRHGYVQELGFDDGLEYITWLLDLPGKPRENDILQIDHGAKQYHFLLSPRDRTLLPVSFNPALAWY